MWWTLGLNLSLVVFLFALWHFLSLRYNRRRAQAILANVESAFSGHGHICEVQWCSTSEFLVRMRFAGCAFANSTILVSMLPRAFPISWLIARLKHRRETLTFQANLLCPPGFNLDIMSHRSQVKLKSRAPKNNFTVRLKRFPPCILTSRRDWQRETANVVQSLAASRGCEFISVSFHRKEPHFSATVPLSAMSGPHCSPVRLFDALRELASGASAARF